MNLKLLEEFGLTKNEVEIFISILKKGQLSATQIAKETGLNRPYIYYAIERLLEKGYITQINNAGKKQFKTLPIKQIIASEEEKLSSFKDLAKELSLLEQTSTDAVSVDVLKGKYAMKIMFKRFMAEIKAKEEVQSIGFDEERQETIEELYLKKIFTVMKEKKIKERCIIAKGKRKLDYAKTTKYKEIDPFLIGNTARMMYQDTVVEVIYDVPIYVVIIKNRAYAQTAKKQFELFWKMAKG